MNQFTQALRLACVAAVLGFEATADAAAPIRLHPDNPPWLEWRGKAVALVTSAEHYGAVLNQDFDFRRYLEAMRRDGMNYTRIFAGSYVEPQGAFGIERNTLAPAPGQFLAPWKRSGQAGYAGGGNKFDLDHFSEEHLARLKQFITEAGRQEIVVELTLFCSTYGDKQWSLHPFNPTSNVQAFAVPTWKSLHALGAEGAARNPAIWERQESLTRWLVRELNGFDNLFYEIQNEPWADHHSMGDFINPYMTDKHAFPNAVEITSAESVAWQRAVAHVLTDEESRLPSRHLIAQNAANFRLALNDGDLVPEASIIHFHYAYPEAVDWNRGLQRVIGFDETGFAGKANGVYLQQAWNFLLSGGGVFNSLDYSFTIGQEEGGDTENKAPGGGGPDLRRQLNVLADFMHSFDLDRMHPDPSLVRRSPGVVVRALSQRGKAHALYVEGRGPTTLMVQLAKGSWTAEWISIESGAVLKRQTIEGRNQPVRLASPEFVRAAAVRLVKS